MADLHKLAQAMCSIDLAESYWTQELPRLPVPDLWLTVSRYLASLKAVQAPTDARDEMLKLIGCKLSRAEVEQNWNNYEHTDQMVKQFMLNEGPQLQRDLKEYANKCQNWATEYWLQDMYLSNPLPLPVNSNPFFMFPRQRFETSEQMLMFATRIIQFSVDFKYRIDQQALKQDFGSGHGKGKPLCMETYKNFFHSYRMPHEDMDRLLPQSRRSNHIVVASCNQFYILRLGQDPLENPYRKEASSQMNETSIFEQLLRIYRVSREHAKREQHQQQASASHHKREPAAATAANCGENTAKNNNKNDGKTDRDGYNSNLIPKVGLFTTENRKTWARLHKKLSHCNGSTTTIAANQSSNSGTGTSSPNTNTESLKKIEDCLFVMCLDSLVRPFSLHKATSGSDGGDDGGDNTTTTTTSNNHSASSSSSKQSSAHGSDPLGEDIDDVVAANIILTGGGTNLFTANRWFDKFLQIIVGRNGVCGINIEHSASEGITVLRFLEEFLEFIRSNPISVPSTSIKPKPTSQINQFNYNQDSHQAIADSSQQVNQLGADSITSPNYEEPKSPSVLLEESDNITPLSWTLDDELRDAINEAEQSVNKLIDNFSLSILVFEKFGRGYIKNQSLSPDAFIQLALQYTFFKLHGHLVSTYESASLRQFRLGRVENIRANTCEAFQWIQAMLACLRDVPKESTNVLTEDRFKAAEGAFIKAITKQVEILRYTIVGGAPDNHLLALRELAKIRYGADELPGLFTDPSYREFLNFRLSTSQLPNESGIIVGYGAVTPDGYGCSYNPCESKIIFCVSSFADCPETSSATFAKHLEESLLEMQQLLNGRNSAGGGK